MVDKDQSSGEWRVNGREFRERVVIRMDLFFGSSGKRLIQAMKAMKYYIGNLTGTGRNFVLGIIWVLHGG